MFLDVPSFWAALKRGLATAVVLQAVRVGLILLAAPDGAMTRLGRLAMFLPLRLAHRWARQRRRA